MPMSRARRVLVVGESIIDVLDTSSGPPVEAAGGSPLNVAVTVGRLGAPVSILTALGHDARGSVLRRHLVVSGVRVRPGPVLRRTSTAVARVGPDGTATYEFDISRPVLGSPGLEDAAVLHTGSLAFCCAPGASTVRRLLARAHQAGVLTTLDPNIRPGLVGDRVAAVRHLEESLPLIDVVKLSDEDAAWLYPELDLDQSATRLLEQGPRLVALTRGSRGASLHTADLRVDVPAAPTTVVDTVGAGDAWMGALLHGLVTTIAPGHPLTRLDATQLRELGDLAARVAAATVARQGADPPWAHTLAPTTA